MTKQLLLDWITLGINIYSVICTTIVTAILIYKTSRFCAKYYFLHPFLAPLRRSKWDWPVIVFLIAVVALPVMTSAIYHWLNH